MNGEGPLRAIVLDFDGVLVESEGIKTVIFSDVFAQFPDHYDEMMAFHHANIASPRETKFRYLAERCGQGESLVERLLASFSASAIERIVSCPEVAGATAFLREFSSVLPLYLASVTPEADLVTVVTRRAWRPYFKQVFGNPPTEKAEAVRHVLRELDARPNDLLFVGDTASDFAVAQSTGLPFIARNGGHWIDVEGVPVAADMIEVAALVRVRMARHQPAGDGRSSSARS